jgi:hypothetical protein
MVPKHDIAHAKKAHNGLILVKGGKYGNKRNN